MTDQHTTTLPSSNVLEFTHAPARTAAPTSHPIDKDKLNAAFARAFRHLRDVSVRDGIQSWDANKWAIAEILPVISELNTLSTTLQKECGVKLPPVEAWGGGQVAQPAKFGGRDGLEDPFINLKKLHKAAPELDLQCLYRGRQCFGFIPVSEEVQRAAIRIAAENGIKVFRMFDMMNDIDNLKIGITAANEYKAHHPEIAIEGAISYISEPRDSIHRAWTLADYGNYAVELAKLGADEIAIKNFAGVGDYESRELIETIRAKLDAAGYGSMAINLHSHGQKPETLVEAIKAGVDKIDVAIGDLSGGPSHTNIRDVLQLLLKEDGVDIASKEVQDHPVMQQLARVEAAIHDVVMKNDKVVYANGNGHKTPAMDAEGKVKRDNFDTRRATLKKITQEQVEQYRMAGGAFSDLSSRIAKNYAGETQGFRDDLFNRILQNGMALWEKAGRFNTVTPGAKILVDQAIKVTLLEMNGKSPTMCDYEDQFLDVATGRFGKNRGMGEGLEAEIEAGTRKPVGDVAWRDAVMMFRAFKLMNKALEDKTLTREAYGNLLTDINLGAPPMRQKFSLKASGLDLMDPELESSLKNVEIKKLTHLVSRSGIDESVKKAVLAELAPGRKASPTTGIAEGKKVLDCFKSSRAGGRVLLDRARDMEYPISSDDNLAVLAMLLKEPGKNADATFNSLFNEIATRQPSEQQLEKRYSTRGERLQAMHDGAKSAASAQVG